MAVCLASWAALLAAGASTPSGMTHKTKSLLVLKLQQLPNTFLERSTTVSSFTQKSICHPAGVPVGLGYPAVALGTARDPGVACPGSVSRLTHSFHALPEEALAPARLPALPAKLCLAAVLNLSYFFATHNLVLEAPPQTTYLKGK